MDPPLSLTLVMPSLLALMLFTAWLLVLLLPNSTLCEPGSPSVIRRNSAFLSLPLQRLLKETLRCRKVLGLLPRMVRKRVVRDGRQALMTPKLASTQDQSWGRALVSGVNWIRIVSSRHESENGKGLSYT